MPRLLWRSEGGGAVSHERGTPVLVGWHGARQLQMEQRAPFFLKNSTFQVLIHLCAACVTRFICARWHKTVFFVGRPAAPCQAHFDKGVRQRIGVNHQSLVIWSGKKVADSTCGVQFTRQAVRRVDPRCESNPPPRPIFTLPAPHDAQLATRLA